MRLRLSVLASLFVVATAAGARDLNDLPGVFYSPDSPSYALEISPDVTIPPPLNADPSWDPETQKLYREAFLLRRVLLQLPCYCACGPRAGHKSLYACFVAPVGSACYSAECEVCLAETRVAKEMVDKGAAVEEIRGALAARFGDGARHDH